jgi:hypothetical protein
LSFFHIKPVVLVVDELVVAASPQLPTEDSPMRTDVAAGSTFHDDGFHAFRQVTRASVTTAI